MVYCKVCKQETTVRTYEEYRDLNPNSEFDRQEYYGACSICAEPDDRLGLGLIEIDDLNN